jgi:hypothetical protein
MALYQKIGGSTHLISTSTAALSGTFDQVQRKLYAPATAKPTLSCTRMTHRCTVMASAQSTTGIW